MSNWSLTFDAIELCIASKDFQEAIVLIDGAIAEAQRVMVDPSFLITQLELQKKKLAQ